LSISDPLALPQWIRDYSGYWENGEWARSGLRPTADVGMIWLR
jgi:hypothetical protein